MKAAVFRERDKMAVVDVPKPTPGPGEVVLKVHNCGICGSDLHAVQYGIGMACDTVMGHEFCGEIHELGTNVNGYKVGDRVTSLPYIVCGTCEACLRDDSMHCAKILGLGLGQLPGAYAEYVRCGVGSLLKLPPNVSSREGALVEPLSVGLHGVNRSQIKEGMGCIVMGAGPIGLLTALVARARNIPSIFVSDVLPSRLALATRLGLDAVPAGTELKQIVETTTSGDGVDLVFECAGVPGTAKDMTSLVRSRGTIVNLGVFKKPVEVDMQAVNFKEISILGSRVYTRRDFEVAIDLAATLPIRDIVTHLFPLPEVQAAFDLFRRGQDVCKVLMVPNGARE